MLSFQSPGPAGTTSGTVTDTVTAQWSENGHGQMVAPVTDRTHEKRHANHVDPGQNTAVTSGPGESRSIRVYIPPDVCDTHGIEQVGESHRTLPEGVSSVGASAVQCAVENGRNRRTRW